MHHRRNAQLVGGFKYEIAIFGQGIYRMADGMEFEPDEFQLLNASAGFLLVFVASYVRGQASDSKKAPGMPRA